MALRQQYDFNDKAGLVYVLATIKEKIKGWLVDYVRKDELGSVTIETDDSLSDTSVNPVQNRVIKAELDKKAPLDSPEFTGVPTAPLAVPGTNDMQVANTAFVVQALKDALAGYSEFGWEVVDSLPETGKDRTFYFVPVAGAEGTNLHDEYVWIGGKWEPIGSTQIDLTGYVREDQLVPIPQSEIDAMFADW